MLELVPCFCLCPLFVCTNTKLIAYFISFIQHTQFSAGEAWEKLNESESIIKSLESECNNLKEILKKYQSSQRTTKTSCLLLLGMLNSATKQNRDLKDQRNILTKLQTRACHAKTQLALILNETLLTKSQEERKHQRETKLKQQNATNRRPVKGESETTDDAFELVDAIDYSLSCSMASVSTSQNSKNDSLTVSSATSIHRFRKVVITIIAAHRLMYFSSQNKSSTLCLVDAHKKNYSQFLCSLVVSASQNKPNAFRACIAGQFCHQNAQTCGNKGLYEENKAKCVLDWFACDNNEILAQLNEIADELNQYVYLDDGKFILSRTNLMGICVQ